MMEGDDILTQAKAVILSGVEFPIAYDGYKISREKIWSSNTGRNNAGKMVGTIIAIKNKVEISLVPLTPAQAKLIDEVVSDMEHPFQTATVLFVDGTQKEMTVYTGDISYAWLSRAIGSNGDGLITGVTLSLIEQ